MRSWRYAVPVLLGVGGFEDGFALLLAGAVLPAIIHQLRPSAPVVGLLISLPFLGSVIGAMIFGRLGDVLGRRRSYLYVTALFVAGSAMGALAPSVQLLLASRFIIGLGIGGDIPTAGSLLAEVADHRSRGRYVSIQSLLWGIGGASAALVAIPFLALGAAAWRYVIALSALPPLAVLALRGSIGESPLWRARSAGRLSRIGRVAGRLSLVASLYFATTFVLAILANYATVLMERAMGLLPTEALLASAAQWAAFLVGSSLVNARSDALGRKPLIVAGTAGLAASLAALRLASSPAQAVAVLMVLWAFGGVAYATTNVYSAELFPTDVRSTCSGICFASGRMGGFLSTLIAPILSLGTLSTWMTPALVPAFAALSVTAFIFAPRTERVPLSAASRDGY